MFNRNLEFYAKNAALSFPTIDTSFTPDPSGLGQLTPSPFGGWEDGKIIDHSPLRKSNQTLVNFFFAARSRPFSLGSASTSEAQQCNVLSLVSIRRNSSAMFYDPLSVINEVDHFFI